jgi:hypothetical protein
MIQSQRTMEACLEWLAGHDLEQLALPPSYERRPTGCSPARKPTDIEFALTPSLQDAGQ